ncbi:hypothetical protein Pint_07432 [Pistacia integerrima]|uniref:Uncharacterized protein n=1 Tax=Pistacia integerrima TaxID=434235 RepID=A0ACC0XVV2_9ROSI|nr:hypothetical protein Pint_07432 [Pistacia integerrima]
MDIERETHSFVRVEKVVGRDDDKKKVIQLLLDSDVNENVSIISIFGFGGLGKTALAQLVYNDEHVINYFQLRMWVCVSNNFNEKIIVENIIKSATGKKTEGLDIDQLKECLRKEIINGKKYFLVLDDIWNENSIMWDKLKTLLMDGERGSKILVTTRSEQVARITSTLNSYVYPLKVLDENKSWSLFTQIAFADGIKPKDSKLVEFGKEIVAKCGGVPLVIMTVGHLLHGINEEDDWLHFKDNEMSKVIEKESDILPILKLSYDYLPSHLKQCFAYCALFPKDYKIKKQKLIYLWMAQGFLQALDKNECLEEVGNKYFTTLLLMSFFQDPQYDEWGNVVACKMHDLLRELAKLVAGTECTFTTIGTVQSVDDKCRHVSLDCGDVKSSWKFPIALYSAKNIRSLLLFYRSNWRFDLDGGYEIFSSYRYLRALDFGQLKFKKLLHSNGKLKHLRYLNFSYMQIEKLSDSILRLWNLETLDLSHCDKLKELPRDIRKMMNLRHLINKKCDSLCGMPYGIGCLTNLQTLSIFVASQRNSKHSGIEELKGLNNLRGKLKD